MQEDLKILINDTQVGLLSVNGNTSRFSFFDEYIQMDNRPVLGQFFEDNLEREHKSQMTLPPWFSNLLPEGRLKIWISNDLDQNHKTISEAKLLKRLGTDLPGAIKAIPAEESSLWYNNIPKHSITEADISRGEKKPSFRFSLAGVAMKFSMIRDGDRFVSPAKKITDSSEWIIKLPEPQIPGLCRNEFHTMEFSARLGFDVPRIDLVNYSNFETEISEKLPKISEDCFAIERFDRQNSTRIHIEDFCQAFGKIPDDKYKSSFESVVNLIIDRSSDKYKDYDEAIRRILFNILIDNGDAHLKNWSFIYDDPTKARLSPLYDVSSTGMHAISISGMDHDLGLQLHKNRRFSEVSRDDFIRLERKVLRERNIYDEELFRPINLIIDEFVEQVNDEFSVYSKSVDYKPWSDYLQKTIYKRSQLFRR